MKSVFLDEARMELIEAAGFYNARRTGLGAQFLDAIEQAVNDIESHPRRWPVFGRKIRRRLISRFPYGVLYRIGRGEITIVAIMHLHRHPNYWIGRLRSFPAD